jgi:hypothetical protein
VELTTSGFGLLKKSLMKKTILFLCISVFYCQVEAQITMNGCHAILGNQDFVLVATANVIDNGVSRNTFESTPLDFAQSCPAGVCEIRVMWNIGNQRWEIQLDNDGPLNTPNYDTAILYYNETASYPNPPDVTLGNWIDAGFCNGNNSLNLTGDVHSTVLSLENTVYQPNIHLIINPKTSYLTVKGIKSKHEYRLINTSGQIISNGNVDSESIIDLEHLSNGVYFLVIKGYQPIKFVF